MKKYEKIITISIFSFFGGSISWFIKWLFWLAKLLCFLSEHHKATETGVWRADLVTKLNWKMAVLQKVVQNNWKWTLWFKVNISHTFIKCTFYLSKWYKINNIKRNSMSFESQGKYTFSRIKNTDYIFFLPSFWNILFVFLLIYLELSKPKE